MSARVLDIRPNLRVSNIGLVNYFEAKADGECLRTALTRAGLPDAP